MGEYDSAQILGATRDFLHVRFAANDGSVNGAGERDRDYEGWASWGAVVPDMSAVVLDAETGAVISRVPLGEDLTSILYSPDGTRAIFSGGSDGIRQAAYEVRTSDYTLTRSLTSSNTDYLGTLFYGPADGGLYATVHTSDGSSQSGGKVSLIRIGEDGAPNFPSEFNIRRSTFAISPDGLTGFIPRSESGNSNELTLDVVELATQKYATPLRLFR